MGQRPTIEGDGGKPPGTLATLIGVYLCAMLALAGAGALVDGLSQGSFGRVRNFGVATLADRPVVFALVALCYLAATLVTAWGAWALLTRLRRRKEPR